MADCPQGVLKEEREATHVQDRVSARRRELPMVKIDKDYVFEGPQGAASLLDLFDGRRQLIIAPGNAFGVVYLLGVLLVSTVWGFGVVT